MACSAHCICAADQLVCPELYSSSSGAAEPRRIFRHLNSSPAPRSIERSGGCVVGNADRLLRPLVYVQLKNVGTGIVADDV
jgi:hypothetical protein